MMTLPSTMTHMWVMRGTIFFIHARIAARTAGDGTEDLGQVEHFDELGPLAGKLVHPAEHEIDALHRLHRDLTIEDDAGFDDKDLRQQLFAFLSGHRRWSELPLSAMGMVHCGSGGRRVTKGRIRRGASAADAKDLLEELGVR